MREIYEPFDNAEEVWFWFCRSLDAHPVVKGPGGRAAFQKRLSGQVPQHRNRRRFADFETNARPRRNNQPLSARHVQMGDAWHAAVL